MDSKILTILISVLFVTACSSTSKPKEPEMSPYERAIFEERKRTNEVLAKAALLSSRSLAVYTRTKQALQQKELTAEQIRIARHQNEYIPTNMDQKVSLPVDSAPEPIIKTIASIAGYEIRFVNQRPPITRSVTIDKQKRMLRDFIFIIEQQTQGYIKNINVDDKYDRKLITVYYDDF